MDDMNKNELRGSAAGVRMADALIEWLHMMYNKKTALRILNTFISTLTKRENEFKLDKD